MACKSWMSNHPTKNLYVKPLYQLNQSHPWQHPSSLEKNRKRNASWILLYTTIPNHHQKVPLARKKEDIENISKLLNEYVEVPATITNAICIGKQLDGPRLPIRLLYHLLKKSLSSFVIIVIYATNHIQCICTKCS